MKLRLTESQFKTGRCFVTNHSLKEGTKVGIQSVWVAQVSKSIPYCRPVLEEFYVKNYSLVLISLLMM